MKYVGVGTVSSLAPELNGQIYLYLIKVVREEREREEDIGFGDWPLAWGSSDWELQEIKQVD